MQSASTVVQPPVRFFLLQSIQIHAQSIPSSFVHQRQPPTTPLSYIAQKPSPVQSKDQLTDPSFSPTGASRAQMSDAKLPIPYRDSCAHLLIPLNRCRYEEYYLPWKCEVSTQLIRAFTRHQTHRLTYFCSTLPQNERHTYEKCQYEEFKLRVAKMDELRAAKNGERSN